MKHHDSLEQANRKMAISLKQLSQWQLSAIPLNYAIAYEFVNGKNTELITAINMRIDHGGALDTFFLENLYKEHVLGQSKFRDDIIEDIDEVLTSVEQNCIKSSKSVSGLINELDNDIARIERGDPQSVTLALRQLKVASTQFKLQQVTFAENLRESKKRTQLLKSELEDVRKEIYLDPVTGLYNKKAMHKHFEAWVADDPSKQIAAIVVNVDYFNQFSTKFGSLIGDVILTKIASKISKYVDESGLPVRVGNDEFMIMLPDVERNVASEIAEKIRQGVEKLRFISSKTGIRLPQMTISLGVSEFRKKEPLNSFIRRSKHALVNAQQSGRNCVVVI